MNILNDIDKKLSKNLTKEYEPVWRQTNGWHKNSKGNGGYYRTKDSNGKYMYDGVLIFMLENNIADTYDGADYRNESYLRCFK